MPIMRTSIHGRRLGLSSTGGILAQPSTLGSTDSNINSVAQMWGEDLLETVSAGGATISNSGVTIISSDSTAAGIFVMSAPVIGAHKEIHFQTPSTIHSMNTTAITIFFNSSLAEGSTFGSTTITITGVTAGTAGSLVLRGLSATVWSIVSHTAAVTT